MHGDMVNSAAGFVNRVGDVARLRRAANTRAGRWRAALVRGPRFEFRVSCFAFQKERGPASVGERGPLRERRGYCQRGRRS